MTDAAHLTKSKLGELALDAAIGIEMAQNSSSDHIESLQAFMNAIDKQLNNTGDDSMLRDETMFPYYSFALAKATDEDEPNRAQFPEIMSRMLDKQRNLDKNPDDLEQIKQFCLAFHEAMIRAVQTNRPSTNHRDGRIRPRIFEVC